MPTSESPAKPDGNPLWRRPSGLSLSAWKQFLQVAKPYWQGDEQRGAWTLLAMLVALMLVETQFAVMLNDQGGEMASALADRDSPRFWSSVYAILGILFFAVPVYAVYYYMRDAFANKWRRWLTGRFLDGYLHDRKYYQLGSVGDIDNPDQRISEDINTFTGKSTHFLLIFLGSVMQLVAFSAVLWSISRLMVGVLAVYALLGTVIALYVFGKPLIHLNFWQLRREADFRFGLMRLRENAESIAFYGGETQERAQIDGKFAKAFSNFAQLIKKQRSLNIFQRGFSQLSLVIPSVILADAVLSGQLEIGRAVQATGAFAAVLGSVALIVDNFENLSRFVAGVDRLQALSQLVLTELAPKLDAAAKPPQIQTRLGQHLALESLTLYTPQFERVLIKDLSLALKAGDGLLITGDSGCGKSSLLRAIAGLWRTGTGVVHHPPLADVLFLPQKPYMPAGTLRSQLIYPSLETSHSDGQLLEILKDVQMSALVDRVGGLDALHDWEKLLSVGEQQRLAFGRVLVRRPRFVMLDEATSALDSASEAVLYERLCRSGTTLISIAHRFTVLRYHTHVLRLLGGGEWEMHLASNYRCDVDAAQPEPIAPKATAAASTETPIGLASELTI